MLGEVAGISAAAMWAGSSLMYSRARVDAWNLNMLKNLVASCALGIQLAILVAWFEFKWSTDFMAYIWLAASAVIGILIGDTFYFRSLQILGARLALILTTIAPIFGALLGWAILGEKTSWLGYGGILLTIAAIAWVISERGAEQERPQIYPGEFVPGLVCGIIAALCQAIGMVASKAGLENCEPLQGSFIRILAALLCSITLSILVGKARQAVSSLADFNNVRLIVPAGLMGAWLGIWFSLIAAKYTNVAVSTTLLSTSPIFSLPLAAIFSGQRFSWRAIVGTLLTVAGVSLVVNSAV